jgi:hypothetical protein
MADLVSTGLTLTAIHDNPEFEVKCHINGDSTATLKVTLTFDKPSAGSWFTSGKVGYYIKDNNGNKSSIISMDYNITGTDTYVQNSLPTFNLGGYAFPITLYILCDLCGNKDDKLTETEYMRDASGNNIIWSINDKRHTHITTPSAPTIVSSTGTTITVNGKMSTNAIDYAIGISTNNGGSYDWKYPTDDGNYTFTGLSQNTEYTFQVGSKCSCGTWYYSPAVKFKTWGMTLDIIGSTTRSITFKGTHTAGSGGNASNTQISYEIWDGNTKVGGPINNTNGANYTFDNLTHNKSYTCKVYTTDMIDNVKESSYNTKLLSLDYISAIEHQHSIITNWQAKIDNVVYNSGITGNPLTFSAISKAIKSTSVDIYNDQYQASEVIEGNNGTNIDTISGNYIVNTSSNLSWYHCEYEIIGTVSDGYNNVSESVIAYTTFPYSWKYDEESSKWYKVRPYIYTTKPNTTNTKGWIPAVAFIHNGTNWKEPNGEE